MYITVLSEKKGNCSNGIIHIFFVHYFAIKVFKTKVHRILVGLQFTFWCITVLYWFKETCTEGILESCTVDKVLTQRTDFTFATAPLAAGIRQSHHYISSFPVCTPQGIQYVLWDGRARWAAVSICQSFHISCTISPHLWHSRILLMTKLREGICRPWVEGLFSKKSFYNNQVELLVKWYDSVIKINLHPI